MRVSGPMDNPRPSTFSRRTPLLLWYKFTWPFQICLHVSYLIFTPIFQSGHGPMIIQSSLNLRIVISTLCVSSQARVAWIRTCSCYQLDTVQTHQWYEHPSLLCTAEEFVCAIRRLALKDELLKWRPQHIVHMPAYSHPKRQLHGKLKFCFFW